jgi:hypothetical protein
MSRGELGPKILRGNRFYKGHRDIVKKASHHFTSKASIPLKMYLKSLAILEKTSIPLKKSSKIIEMSSKSLLMFIKSSYLLKNSLHLSKNVF